MSMSDRGVAVPPYVRFTLLGLLWGANFLFMKLALRAMAPQQAVWLRLLFGTLALCPFLPAAFAAVRRDRRLAWYCAAMSLMANIVTFHCFMEGTRLLGSGVAGAVSGAIPLVTALLAAATLKSERLNASRFCGVLLGLCGVIALTAPWRTGSAASLAGAGYMLLGACGYAGAFVYAKRFLTGTAMKPAGLAAIQMLAATVFYAPLTDFSGLTAVLPDWRALASVAIGLGALGSGLAYVLYYGVVRDLGAVRASSVTYLPPVVALVLGALFLGESVTAGQLAGACLVLAGVAILRRARSA